MGLILIVLLVFFVFGGLPTWGYHSYGYAPSGIVVVLLVVVVVLAMSGRL